MWPWARNVKLTFQFKEIMDFESTIDVEEEQPIDLNLPNGSTVGELVSALNKVKATSRDVITILQGIKRAGALHAELIIQ